MENQLDGLPQYGVTLSGGPENPVIENHSGRQVIGYVVATMDENGYGSIDQPLLATSMQPTGIPDGGSLYVRAAMPINPPPGPIQFATLSPFGPQGRIVGLIASAVLRNVVFGDGEFAGTDEHGAFELFSSRAQAIREVGAMAKAGKWEQIEALALANPKLSPLRLAEKDGAQYVERLSAASCLVLERIRYGDAAAAQLAEIYSSLPTVWK